MAPQFLNLTQNNYNNANLTLHLVDLPFSLTPLSFPEHQLRLQQPRRATDTEQPTRRLMGTHQTSVARWCVSAYRSTQEKVAARLGVHEGMAHPIREEQQQATPADGRSLERLKLRAAAAPAPTVAAWGSRGGSPCQKAAEEQGVQPQELLALSTDTASSRSTWKRW